jgi:hypothetical protein
MDNLFSLLGLLGPISLIVALVVIALLSQRLGSVTKRTALYRWYYVSVVLVTLSVIGKFIQMSVPEDQRNAAAAVADIAFTAGLCLAVVVAWRYWGWLLHERGKEMGNRQS